MALMFLVKNPPITTKCDCGHSVKSEGCGTGYGQYHGGTKKCYACIGKEDEESLANAKIGDKFTFYLTETKDKKHPLEVTNWPGSFRIPIYGSNVGRHNIAGTQEHAWFPFRGKNFHGVTYGSNTQILHVKCIKGDH